MPRNCKQLHVWEKSHRMTLDVYRMTNGFPREEIYGLVSQMRRAAVSVASNIAEGCGRGSETDMARFLQIAQGSASELAYQTLLARDLGWLGDEDEKTLTATLNEIGRMLTSFICKLRTPQPLTSSKIEAKS